MAAAWVPLLPQSVQEDIAYLEKGFVNYFFSRATEDYANVWFMYAGAAVVAPLLGLVCRRVAAATPMRGPGDVGFVLALAMLAAAVAVHPNSNDARHMYQAHQVAAWGVWATAILLLFDIAHGVLESWRRTAPTRGMVPLATGISAALSAFAVLVCGEFKMDGGGWGLHTRSVFWQALGYAALALSAAFFVLPLWLTVEQQVRDGPGRLLPALLVSGMGIVLICCSIQIADVRFGVSKWTFYSLAVVPEIGATFVSCFGGVYLFFAPLRVVASRVAAFLLRLVGTVLAGGDGRRSAQQRQRQQQRRKQQQPETKTAATATPATKSATKAE